MYDPVLGETFGPLLGMVPVVAAVAITLGVHTQFSCMVVAAYMTFAMRDAHAWHHYWNCGLLLMSILSFTSCGSLYTVQTLLEDRKEDLSIQPASTSKGTGQGEDVTTTNGNWAKPLIALHISLIYFWSGCDKFHPAWINGSLLQGVIVKASPMRGVFIFLFPTKELQLLACALLTCCCIAIELSLGFFLCSKQFHLYAVALAFSMHIGMSFLCGHLAAYTPLAWLCLIAVIDDERVNAFLCDSRNFVIAVLAFLLMNEWTHNIEHFVY